MARHTVVAVLVVALAVSPAFAAKLYKWLDEAGNVSYQDRPPPEGQGRVEERDVRGSGTASDGGPAAAKLPVTLYAVPACSSCDAARMHLKQRGVPFKEVNVSASNVAAQQEMKKKVGELSVPTITVGAKVMMGYMASLLDGELDAVGYPKSKPAAGEGEAASGEEQAAGEGARRLQGKLAAGDGLDLEDFLDQLQSVRKMGSLKSLSRRMASI